jgi:hypothetical protein
MAGHSAKGGQNLWRLDPPCFNLAAHHFFSLAFVFDRFFFHRSVLLSNQNASVKMSVSEKIAGAVNTVY